MSMHLEKPYLTTASYKKREEKITKAKQAELERGWRERNVRLKEMHLPKETFEQYLEWVYGKGKKAKTEKNSKTRIKTSPVQTVNQLSNNDAQAGGVVENTKQKAEETKKNPQWIMGACTTKPSPVYTGSKVVGIATMHKSNMVPIFSDDEAKDVARMRR